MTYHATQSSMNVCSWTPLHFLICFLHLAVFAFLHVFFCFFSPGAVTLYDYLTFSDNNVVMDIN